MWNFAGILSANTSFSRRRYSRLERSVHVTSAPSLSVFRSRLKTHLCRRCFAWLHCHSYCCAWEVTPSLSNTLLAPVTYLRVCVCWQWLVRVHSERQRSYDRPAELRVRLPCRPVLPERALLRRRAGGRHRAAHELLAARVRAASRGRPDPALDAELLMVRVPRRRFRLARRRRPVRLQGRPQFLGVRRPTDDVVHRR